MPEEIKRLVTDRLSDLLLTPDKLSIENLGGKVEKLNLDPDEFTDVSKIWADE